jgi:hypothetical protein
MKENANVMAIFPQVSLANILSKFTMSASAPSPFVMQVTTRAHTE